MDWKLPIIIGDHLSNNILPTVIDWKALPPDIVEAGTMDAFKVREQTI